MGKCNICLRNVEICYNFGGMCCKSCAAFFRRWVRSGHFLECKNDVRCCVESVESNVPVCRKCRMMRCLAEGLNPIYVRDAKQPCDIVARPTTRVFRVVSLNLGLPLLSRMTEAVRWAFQYRPVRTSNPEEHYGTSETKNYTTFTQQRVLSYNELKLFRLMIDRAPLLSELDTSIRDQIFKNAMTIYVVFISFLNNLQQSPPNNRNRYYCFVNNYVDIHIDKLKELFMTYRPPTCIANSRDDYTPLATELLAHLRYCIDLVATLSGNMLETEEDVAALILALLIHSNRNSGIKAIKQLSSIWNELHIHFNVTKRDPSLWGNVILLMSGFETASMQYTKILEMIDLLMGNSIYKKLEQAPIEECDIQEETYRGYT